MFNLPSTLLADLHSIETRIEEAIRQDERLKLLQRFAAEYDDRNGETSSLNLGDSAAKKLRQRRGFHANSKLGKLYRCLAYRSYPVTKNTLIRESGMTPLSFQKAIQTLRRKGYKIETLSGYGAKRRYKLAS